MDPTYDELLAWLQRFFGSGWFTKQALQQARNVPYTVMPGSPYGGQYGQHGVTVRNPGIPVSLHEYGHYYDELNRIVNDPGFQNLYPEYMLGTSLPFVEAANRYKPQFPGEIQAFPGMYGNPKIEATDLNTGKPTGFMWGGPGEMYARFGEKPWTIPPPMRQYYPQYTQAAYSKPAGEVETFEDGSAGYVNQYSLPNPPGYTRGAWPSSYSGEQIVPASSKMSQSRQSGARTAPDPIDAYFKTLTPVGKIQNNRPPPPGNKPPVNPAPKSSGPIVRGPIRRR